MFTSMDVDEDLFMAGFALSGARTKKAFVEETIRLYIRLHEQGEIRLLRGKLRWEGDLASQRQGRHADPG